ncbi:hypothetical protein ACTWP5_16625 [Streptomyces sp. 4N509B]|uniref:hypothetical protein n=1 Tax=Streptomyces sp. 4N509B TaxID=3457413 RepID=UPI003FD472C5
MNGPDGAVGPLNEEFDPDAVLWVRGVDYVSGWRDAQAAVGELAEALAGAGVDLGGVRLRADAAPDGSGVVHLTCSSSTARDLALLARVTAARLRRAS